MGYAAAADPCMEQAEQGPCIKVQTQSDHYAVGSRALCSVVCRSVLMPLFLTLRTVGMCASVVWSKHKQTEDRGSSLNCCFPLVNGSPFAWRIYLKTIRFFFKQWSGLGRKSDQNVSLRDLGEVLGALWVPWGAKVSPRVDFYGFWEHLRLSFWVYFWWKLMFFSNVILDIVVYGFWDRFLTIWW